MSVINSLTNSIVSYPNNRVKLFISGNLLKIKKPAPAKNTGSKTNVL